MSKAISIVGCLLAFFGLVLQPLAAQTRYPAERNHSPITPQVAGSATNSKC